MRHLSSIRKQPLLPPSIADVLKIDYPYGNVAPFVNPTPHPQPDRAGLVTPGLHILANFRTPHDVLLQECTSFRNFINEQILYFGLTSVGEAYHNFPGGGFTGVICLTESHLSIHTWPEHHYITFDVFLSNYHRDNRATTRALYDAVCTFFDATVLLENFIER